MLSSNSSGQQHLRLTPDNQQQQQHIGQQRREFSVKSPGNDPLELLRQSSEKRQLCDESGFRKPDRHWVFEIATSSSSVEAVRASYHVVFPCNVHGHLERAIQIIHFVIYQL